MIDPFAENFYWGDFVCRRYYMASESFTGKDWWDKPHFRAVYIEDILSMQFRVDHMKFDKLIIEGLMAGQQDFDIPAIRTSPLRLHLERFGNAFAFSLSHGNAETVVGLMAQPSHLDHGGGDQKAALQCAASFLSDQCGPEVGSKVPHLPLMDAIGLTYFKFEHESSFADWRAELFLIACSLHIPDRMNDSEQINLD